MSTHSVLANQDSLAQRRARLSAVHAGQNEPAASAPLPPPASVVELVERAGDLAALPQVVMQVIGLTGSPSVHATDVERLVGNDQALAAKLLTLANSSYFGLPKRVSSLHEAVVFLGFNAVRNLALTITSFNLFLGKSDHDSLVRRDLWKHALGTGLCGRLLASAVPGAAISEQIYTAALLHDIGKTLLWEHFPQDYDHAVSVSRRTGLPLFQIERDYLPFTHTEVGEALAHKWNLPDGLVEAIALHHEPDAATHDPKTCAAVGLASDIAAAFGTDPAGAAASENNGGHYVNFESLALLEIKADALHRISAACAAELRAGSALASLM